MLSVEWDLMGDLLLKADLRRPAPVEAGSRFD